MAADEKRNETSEVARRDLLRAGVAALGVAVLPSAGQAAAPRTATVEDAVAMWRPEYLRLVERIAEENKARFVSGELHGFNDADGDAIEDERLAGFYGPDHKYNPPGWAFEKELREKYAQGFPHAYLILACSPSEEIIDGGCQLADAQSAAGEALFLDVLRIARSRGWYTVTPGEEPTNEELGIAGVLS
jgi:hypothetical protein